MQWYGLCKNDEMPRYTLVSRSAEYSIGVDQPRATVWAEPCWTKHARFGAKVPILERYHRVLRGFGISSTKP